MQLNLVPFVETIRLQMETGRCQLNATENLAYSPAKVASSDIPWLLCLAGNPTCGTCV